jgi:hypothetical protein
MSACKHWVAEEDTLLRLLYGTLQNDWDSYTKYFPHRSAEAIRRRYQRLRKAPKKEPEPEPEEEEDPHAWDFLNFN